LIVAAHGHGKAEADDQRQQSQRGGKHGVEVFALVFFERANSSAEQVTDEGSAPLCDKGDRENGERIIDNRVQVGIRMPDRDYGTVFKARSSPKRTNRVFDLNQL
jgi:hypothetical protein